jgi:drug/metabolite transporter (DMT)-like permease
MTNIQISVLLGLLSALFGAGTNLTAKHVMSFTRSRDFLCVNFFLIFIVLLPFSPFYFFLQVNYLVIGLVVITSLMDVLSNYLYFRAFEVCDTITASSILSLSPLFMLTFAPVFQKANPLTLSQGAGILLILAGILCLNYESQQGNGIPRRIDLRPRREILIPLGSALIFGINVYGVKFLFDQNWTNPPTYYLFRVLIISIFSFIIFKPDLSWVNRTSAGYTAKRAVLVLMQWLLLFYAVEVGSPAIVKAISDSSPFFIVLFSLFFLKQKITKLKISGTILVIFGLFLISI